MKGGDARNNWAVLTFFKVLIRSAPFVGALLLIEPTLKEQTHQKVRVALQVNWK